MGAAEAAVARGIFLGDAWRGQLRFAPEGLGEVGYPESKQASKRDVQAGRGTRSTWAVPTPIWLRTAHSKTLSSQSSRFQDPPQDALIGWALCPGPVNLGRRRRRWGAWEGLRSRPRLPYPQSCRPPKRAQPPWCQIQTPAGERAGDGVFLPISVGRFNLPPLCTPRRTFIPALPNLA